MKRIFKAIKAFFRRMAIYVVTAYANRIYRKAVQAADKRHAEEKETIYVANAVVDASELRTYNRKEFRRAKRILRVSNPKEFNLAMMKKAAWYYTPNRLEQDGMSPRDKELRRLAFVKHLLRNAKLV